MIDEVLPAPEWQPPAKKSQSPTFEAADINENGTTAATAPSPPTWSHLDLVGQQYPNLTTLVDYGDSWKQDPGCRRVRPAPPSASPRRTRPTAR